MESKQYDKTIDDKNNVDEITEDFIETVEQAKQEQHPTVDGAVSGYVEDIDNADGPIYVKISVPAYDDEMWERVADVDGTVNQESMLYPELVSEFDDISKLPIQNPIPVEQGSTGYTIPEEDENGFDVFEIIGLANNKKDCIINDLQVLFRESYQFQKFVFWILAEFLILSVGIIIGMSIIEIISVSIIHSIISHHLINKEEHRIYRPNNRI